MTTAPGIVSIEDAEVELARIFYGVIYGDDFELRGMVATNRQPAPSSWVTLLRSRLPHVSEWRFTDVVRDLGFRSTLDNLAIARRRQRKSYRDREYTLVQNIQYTIDEMEHTASPSTYFRGELAKLKVWYMIIVPPGESAAAAPSPSKRPAASSSSSTPKRAVTAASSASDRHSAASAAPVLSLDGDPTADHLVFLFDEARAHEKWPDISMKKVLHNYLSLVNQSRVDDMYSLIVEAYFADGTRDPSRINEAIVRLRNTGRGDSAFVKDWTTAMEKLSANIAARSMLALLTS